jgi:glycerol-3-phosphate dehydrogenase (NAD(P)+)
VFREKHFGSSLEMTFLFGEPELKNRMNLLGQALGAGRSLDEARATTPMVAEGVRTTLAACTLAERSGIEMPIAQQMREVLYHGKPPRAAVEDLMMRSLKRE